MTQVEATSVDTKTCSCCGGVPAVMEKVDQDPSTPRLRYSKRSVCDYDWIGDASNDVEIDIQIPAGINNDRRRFDRHYELLFWGKRRCTGKERINEKRRRDYYMNFRAIAIACSQELATTRVMPATSDNAKLEEDADMVEVVYEGLSAAEGHRRRRDRR